MNIWENVTKTTTTNAHGEVNMIRIEEGALPREGWELFTDKTKDGAWIVGHSEQGHHHVLERENVTIEKREDRGFTILKAIVTAPTSLRQDASTPHEPQIVEAGTYIITNAREKPFFQEQARRVAD